MALTPKPAAGKPFASKQTSLSRDDIARALWRVDQQKHSLEFWRNATNSVLNIMQKALIQGMQIDFRGLGQLTPRLVNPRTNTLQVPSTRIPNSNATIKTVTPAHIRVYWKPSFILNDTLGQIPHPLEAVHSELGVIRRAGNMPARIEIEGEVRTALAPNTTSGRIEPLPGQEAQPSDPNSLPVAIPAAIRPVPTRDKNAPSLRELALAQINATTGRPTQPSQLGRIPPEPPGSEEEVPEQGDDDEETGQGGNVPGQTQQPAPEPPTAPPPAAETPPESTQAPEAPPTSTGPPPTPPAPPAPAPTPSPPWQDPRYDVPAGYVPPPGWGAAFEGAVITRQQQMAQGFFPARFYPRSGVPEYQLPVPPFNYNERTVATVIAINPATGIPTVRKERWLQFRPNAIAPYNALR